MSDSWSYISCQPQFSSHFQGCASFSVWIYYNLVLIHHSFTFTFISPLIPDHQIHVSSPFEDCVRAINGRRGAMINSPGTNKHTKVKDYGHALLLLKPDDVCIVMVISLCCRSSITGIRALNNLCAKLRLFTPDSQREQTTVWYAVSSLL